MVVLEKTKCAACGRCSVVCSHQAISAFGYPEIDPDLCADCRPGKHLLNSSDRPKRRACVEYCEVRGP